jgi:hypothetical protein
MPVEIAAADHPLEPSGFRREIVEAGKIAFGEGLVRPGQVDPDVGDRMLGDHAVFQGNVEAFIAYAFPFMDGVMSQHVITNVWIDLTGPDEAFSECYFSGFHDFPADGGGRLERVVGGRYLDRHMRRNGEWRIAARTLAIDWYHERPGNSVWDRGRYANLPNRGAPKPDDPLYRLHPRGAAL